MWLDWAMNVRCARELFCFQIKVVVGVKNNAGNLV